MSEPDWELPQVELPFPVSSLDPSGPGGPLSGLPPGDRGFFAHPEAGVDQPARWVSGQEVAQANHDFATMVSSLINLTPVVGDVKGLVEVFAGHDLITGDELAWWEMALSVASLIPEVKGAKGVEAIIQFIGKAARVVDSASDVESIYEAGTGGN